MQGFSPAGVQGASPWLPLFPKRFVENALRNSAENACAIRPGHKEGQEEDDTRVVAIAIGLIFGIVWMSLGFEAALLTGGLALVGWFVGSLIEGTIHFTEVWNVLQGRRRSLD